MDDRVKVSISDVERSKYFILACEISLTYNLKEDDAIELVERVRERYVNKGDNDFIKICYETKKIAYSMSLENNRKHK